MVSGYDADSDDVWSSLVAEGVGPRHQPATIADVEQKVAVQMNREGVRHATVVINNRICKGPDSCRVYVPRILYEGSTLTVKTPYYTAVLHGRRKRS